MTMTLEKLVQAYETERRHYRLAEKADDIPLDYDAITSRWLTATLGKNHPGAEVLGHRLDTADEGNSSRRRIFLEWNETGKNAGLPASVFCKATHSLPSRISIGLPGCIHGEVDFYNHVRHFIRVESPKALHAAVDSRTYNAIVVFEDMGAETVFCTHTTDIGRDQAERQMRILADFHGQFLANAGQMAALSVFPTWPQRWRLMLGIGMEKGSDQGFIAARDVIPARVFARHNDIWALTQRSVELHDRLPHTFNHGDPHLRNWYITPRGEMGLGDWQMNIRGHWSRDLAYTLATSLAVEDRRQWERELLRYYADLLGESSGRTISFQEVFDNYRQQLMTVLAFWTLTLTPPPELPDMQPSDASLEFIRRISTAIDDLDTLDSFS